jgi:hypothetical protein
MTLNARKLLQKINHGIETVRFKNLVLVNHRN